VGECSKAFKGYDYVEKHIMSKHPEDIERIRADAEYFNNYVCDPNHLVPNTPQNTTQFGQPMMMGGRMPPPVQAAVAGTPWDQIPRIGFDNWGFQARPRMPADLPRDPRQVKSYVDLDAPSEGDSNISFY
jgi:hypothetical protein